MCGIIGLVNSDSSSHVNQSLVDALTVLQHRGQDAAGDCFDYCIYPSYIDARCQ